MNRRAIGYVWQVKRRRFKFLSLPFQYPANRFTGIRELVEEVKSKRSKCNVRVFSDIHARTMLIKHAHSRQEYVGGIVIVPREIMGRSIDCELDRRRRPTRSTP